MGIHAAILASPGILLLSGPALVTEVASVMARSEGRNA